MPVISRIKAVSSSHWGRDRDAEGCGEPDNDWALHQCYLLTVSIFISVDFKSLISLEVKGAVEGATIINNFGVKLPFRWTENHIINAICPLEKPAISYSILFI
jgi:hypothetical protein